MYEKVTNEGENMSELMAIRDTAQMVTDAIAAALRVEVTISDAEYNLVAGTADYLRVKGSHLNRRFKEALYQGDKALVIAEPGKHPLCQGCTWQGKCPEKAILTDLIHFEGKVIGDICLIALHEKERARLLESSASLFPFLDQMAALVTAKLAEKAAQRAREAALQELETTIDCAEEGLVTVDSAGIIQRANLPAATLLGTNKEALIGKSITSLIPSPWFKEVLERNERVSEEEVTGLGKGGNQSFLVSVHPVLVNEDVVGAVLSLRDMRQVKKLVYNLTNWHQAYSFQDIIGQSQAIRLAKAKALQVAGSSSTVLLRGATGTGKELFARAIHTASQRNHGPFVAVNCAAIPDALLESELFGYADGAFTGAKRGGKPGKFELANKGTIFLDEVGDLPLHLQAKLLRVLQEHEVERIGGKAPLPVDVRVIAATNRNLEEMIQNKSFRPDLYYRLNVIPIEIPPLKDRREDIVPLARFFLTKFCKLLGKEIHTFSPATMKRLTEYAWPGNVRELENAIEHAVNLAAGREIQVTDLPASITAAEVALETTPQGPVLKEIKAATRSLEKSAILEALQIYGMSEHGKVLAARYLGMSRATLYRKIKKFGIGPVSLVRTSSQQEDMSTPTER